MLWWNYYNLDDFRFCLNIIKLIFLYKIVKGSVESKVESKRRIDSFYTLCKIDLKNYKCAYNSFKKLEIPNICGKK